MGATDSCCGAAQAFDDDDLEGATCNTKSGWMTGDSLPQRRVRPTVAGCAQCTQRGPGGGHLSPSKRKRYVSGHFATMPQAATNLNEDLRGQRCVRFQVENINRCVRQTASRSATRERRLRIARGAFNANEGNTRVKSRVENIRC